MKYLLLALAILFTVFGSVVILAFSWGLTLWLYYGWFVMPVFGSLPAINYLQSVGLIMFVGLFKNQNNYDNIPEDERAYQLGMVFVRPFTAILVGYIITLFI